MDDEILQFPKPGKYAIDYEKFKKKATLEDLKSCIILLKPSFKINDDTYSKLDETRRKAYKKMNKYFVEVDE